MGRGGGRGGGLVASRARGECRRALCCGLQAWGSCWVEARGVQGGLALHQAQFWVSCPDCPGPVTPVCVWLCVVGGRREEIGVAGTMGLSGILVLMEGVRLWGPRVLTVLGHWRGRAGPGKGLPAWEVGPRAPLGEGGRRLPGFRSWRRACGAPLPNGTERHTSAPRFVLRIPTT